MTSISASRVPASNPDTGATHPYTCNTCQVAFRNSELQRGHMRSDWHRYNLKRRVTSLPPISSEVFTEKVLQAQASSTAAATKAAYEKTCTPCQRTYFSENAYQNHVASQKHKTRLAEAKEEQVDDEASSVMSSTFSLGEPVPTNEIIDSDAEGEFNEVVEGIKKSNLKDIPAATRRPSRPHHSAAPEDAKSTATASSVTADGEEASIESSLTRCLFCNYDSQTVFKNAVHMEKLHGMFIPEKPYLVDLDGLIESLREKIHDLQECLYCGKLKPTVFGLQTHMRDKGHCKIPFETELDQLEIGGFYDFRSTYSDDEDESDSDSEDALPGKNRRGGVKLGATRPSKVAGEDGEAVEEGEGWETDSSASSVDSADLDQRKQAHKNSHSVFYSEYELHLPSGRTAGHRSLNKYFKQNLHNHPSAEERQEQLAIEAAASSDSDEEEGDQRVARRNERERGRALTSRANGGTGMIGVSDDKKKAVLAVENRSKKIEERERRKFQWGNNKQSNFQKHFRDHLLQ